MCSLLLISFEIEWASVTEYANKRLAVKQDQQRYCGEMDSQAPGGAGGREQMGMGKVEGRLPGFL